MQERKEKVERKNVRYYKKCGGRGAEKNKKKERGIDKQTETEEE